MPFRAMLYTLVTVTIALVATVMWVRSVGPMLQEVNASTRPAAGVPPANRGGAGTRSAGGNEVRVESGSASAATGAATSNAESATRATATMPAASAPATTAASKPAPPDKQFKRVVRGTMLLAFVLICFILVVGFFATMREWLRYRLAAPARKRRRTQYVDAWKIAGERMQSEGEQSEGEEKGSE